MKVQLHCTIPQNHEATKVPWFFIQFWREKTNTDRKAKEAEEKKRDSYQVLLEINHSSAGVTPFGYVF